MPLQVSWVYRTQRNIISSPRFAGDLVVMTGRDGYLRALDRSHGEVRWSVVLDRGTSSSPTVDGSEVYVADEAGSVRRIELMDGRVRWKVSLDVGVAANPVVWGGLLLVNAGAARPGVPGGGLRVLDAESGSVVWSVDSPSGARATPAVVGETIVTADHDGAIAAFEADGSPVWRLERDTPVYGELCAVGASAVAVPMGSGEILVVDVRNGEEIWFFETGRQMLRGGVAATEDRIFAGAADGRLYSFEHPTGRVQWTVEERAAREWVSWSPPVIAGDRVIALTSGDVSKLVVVSASDGTRLDEVELEGPGTARPDRSNGEVAITTSENAATVQCIVGL